VNDGCKAALSNGGIGKPLGEGQVFPLAMMPVTLRGPSCTEDLRYKGLCKPLEETDHFSRRPHIPSSEIWAVFPKSLATAKDRISIQVRRKKTPAFCTSHQLGMG